MDVFPSEIEIVGNWLFHNSGYENEIDCYHLPLPIESEVWTSIPTANSPFGTSDSSVLEKTIESLDKGYD